MTRTQLVDRVASRHLEALRRESVPAWLSFVGRLFGWLWKKVLTEPRERKDFEAIAKAVKAHKTALVGLGRSMEQMDLAESGFSDKFDELLAWIGEFGVPKDAEAMENVRTALERMRGTLGHIRGALKSVCKIVDTMARKLPPADKVPAPEGEPGKIKLSADDESLLGELKKTILEQGAQLIKLARGFAAAGLLDSAIVGGLTTIMSKIEQEKDAGTAAKMTKFALTMGAKVVEAGKTYCAQMKALAG